MKIDEYVPVSKWILQKGPQIMLVALTGRLLGALIRLLGECFSPEDQQRDPAHNGDPCWAVLSPTLIKTNLQHECWDMIINVLIKECITFTDINELYSGWFMGPD